ncbi:MAG: MBL fold metallo-hydrolase [Candidatus Limnocylindrales bacterium]
MELAPGIRRVGTGLVNVYLIEEAGEVTIVDAGMAGMWSDVQRELTEMGRTVADIRAVVLTHAHVDHVGFAERVRHEARIPVHVHEADAALARGEVKPEHQQMGRLAPLAFLRFLWYGLRKGGLRAVPIKVVAPFGDGATLNVPGAPRVILVPGHTPGSAALYVPSRNTLFAGDALATLNAVNGTTGPQIAPFGSDPKQALASLNRLTDIDASLLLPGHGAAWTGGVPAALEAVRRSATTIHWKETPPAP